MSRKLGLKTARLLLGGTALGTFYFGPWFPTTLAEAKGWFKPRRPYSSRPDVVAEGDDDKWIQVVIPVRSTEPFNTVQDTVQRLTDAAARPDRLNVVLVHDDPSKLKGLNCGEAGAVSIIKGPGRGRGPTQNAGARAEIQSSPLLLFLHADTQVPTKFDSSIRAALGDETVLMTAFSFGLDDEDSPALRFVVNAANGRSRVWWMPYGDQALAFRREVFERHGGFRDDFPMMEDFDLVRRVRGEALTSSDGMIVILNDKVVSSARRWRDRGIIRTTGMNWLFCAAFVYCGIGPDTIFTWYYG